MVQIANTETEGSSGSKRKQDKLTHKAIERKEDEEKEAYSRMQRLRCTGCHRRGHEYKQCPCRSFAISCGESRRMEEKD